MQNKRVALVTGANQGIGLQIAKDLTAHGFTVLVGSRDLCGGERAAGEAGADAQAVRLDVTDQSTIDALADRIEREFGRLDVLVNNAGISRAADPEAPLEHVAQSGRLGRASLSDVRAIWDTNVFGALAVTQAMLALLRRSPSPRVVNVSSITGSLSWSGDAANPYRAMFGSYAASKTALNAITVGLAADLEADGIKVNAACPGFTKTNLNGYRGTGTVEDGAQEPVRLALLGDDGPTGTFSNSAGPIPW